VEPSEQSPREPRDPAWAWYLAAAVLVLALVVAHLTGLLDHLGP
jgi:hypothetical protein